MNVAAQLGFTFNVGKLTVANVHNAADTGRFAERARMPGNSITDRALICPTFAFGFHQNLFQQNFILHTVSKIAFAPLTLSQHLGELFPVNALHR
jgi:hypothetical protein